LLLHDEDRCIRVTRESGSDAPLLDFCDHLAFLPGLFPIEPLFVVNWSLSYEWWFYVTCVGLVSVLGLGTASPQRRLLGIATVGLCLVALSAAGVPGVPIRGLSFLSGLLLVEANRLHLGSVSAPLAVAAALTMFAICVGFAIPAGSMLRLFAATDKNILFWVCLAPVFAAAFVVGAALFLAVEKPFSLGAGVPRKVSASAATFT
jgi:hypothetical protein